MITRGFKENLNLRLQKLEDKVEFLEASRARWVRFCVVLEKDVTVLTKHLGLEFKDVNERQLVAVEKFDKSKKT